MDSPAREVQSQVLRNHLQCRASCRLHSSKDTLGWVIQHASRSTCLKWVSIAVIMDHQKGSKWLEDLVSKIQNRANENTTKKVNNWHIAPIHESAAYV